MAEKFLADAITAAGAIGLMLAAVIGFSARRRFVRALMIIIGGIGFAAAVVALHYGYRPQPFPETRSLFPGVEYIRDVRQTPVPLVIHVVRIDLTAPGIRFIVTPRQPVGEFEMTARTTSAFLQEFGLQVAINADYFDPWRDYGIQDYYPHAGDGVNLRGVSINDGVIETYGYSENFQTLSILANHTIVIGAPDPQAITAVSGYIVPVQHGEIVVPGDNPGYLESPHPRTGIGVDQDQRTLMLFVIDGRQPNYSHGVTMAEFAEIMIAYGAVDALNLDGGGSSTLVVQGTDGTPLVLNSPIHARIPGLERPIGSHFGIYIQGESE